jgi:hypothetical protein
LVWAQAKTGLTVVFSPDVEQKDHLLREMVFLSLGGKGSGLTYGCLLGFIRFDRFF